MKFSFSLIAFALLLLSATAFAQAPAISGGYFPSNEEFPELHKISEVSFDDHARLSKIADGRLFEDVGFEKYEQRIYSDGHSGSVSIEAVTLMDFHAAYSALTLLRLSDTHDGPPGDAYTANLFGIQFAKNKYWVRIKADGIKEDRLKQIANSMSNKIRGDRKNIPYLISHMPKLGYCAGSLDYFPALKVFETSLGKKVEQLQKLNFDMQIARADYSLGNSTGSLMLLSFPTSQIAEECYEELTKSSPPLKKEGTQYAKNAGPIVALLDGNFDPVTADKILSSIRYRYSIRWMDEDRQKIVWGLPTGILKTVVKSLFFVVLLSAVSILVGAAYALFRFRLRERSAHNFLDRLSEITRLRLR